MLKEFVGTPSSTLNSTKVEKDSNLMDCDDVQSVTQEMQLRLSAKSLSNQGFFEMNNNPTTVETMKPTNGMEM